MLLILLLTLLLLTIGVFSAIYGIGPTPSHSKARKKMIQILKRHNPEYVADLGSGWGTLVRSIAKQLPHAQVVGIEGSWIPFYTSLLFQRKRMQFRRKNIYDESIQDFDAIVCYLYPKAMKRLKPKLESELKKGTLIISNSFHIPGLEPVETHYLNDIYKSAIYVYHC